MTRIFFEIPLGALRVGDMAVTCLVLLNTAPVTKLKLGG